MTPKTAQPRKTAGTPAGGQWKATVRSESSATLDDPHTPCGQCGTPTQRTSGLCRKCDPTSKANRPTSTPAAGGTVRRGGERLAPTYDRTRSVPADQIRACAYDHIPAVRSTGTTGTFRQCANAVIAPAVYCHRHGGDTATSLGRTVAKATAEAGRGECWPLAAEHWEQADARLEAAEGTLADILAADTSDIAAAFVKFRSQASASSVGRMSPNNQLLILVQHWSQARSEAGDDADSSDVWEQAVRRTAEPHMTASNWAKHGRHPTATATPVAALWAKPVPPARRDDETDEQYEERKRQTRRTIVGSVLEYPLSATDGDPYETPPSPLDTFRPSGYGDPDRAIDTMTELAAQSGITVEMVDHRPHGAYAVWEASRSRIQVWSGIAGGDRRAIAHSLAHELGHARLGHGQIGASETERHEKETAAEAFAALACAHHGLDTAPLSVGYIADWRHEKQVDMRGSAGPALRHAIAAYEEYVTAVAAEG